MDGKHVSTQASLWSVALQLPQWHLPWAREDPAGQLKDWLLAVPFASQHRSTIDAGAYGGFKAAVAGAPSPDQWAAVAAN